MHLDEVRVKQAREKGLEHVEKEKVYRLKTADRIQRISVLLTALAGLEGGAKQAIHYTDVSPDLMITCTVRGGNSIFGHIIGSKEGKPEIKKEAFKQALSVFKDEILSKIYVGWVEGYLDNERARFQEAVANDELLKQWNERIIIDHPKKALAALCEELKNNENWLT